MSQAQPIFEIHDPEINVEEIMARLRQRIEGRRAQASEQGLDYDHLVDGHSKTYGQAPTTADLLYDLQQLRECSESIWVSLDVRNRRLGLINPLAFRIEKLLHRLAVKYVNMLAGRQTAANRMVANLIDGLVQWHDRDQARIEKLEEIVTELNERLNALERPQGQKG